MLGRMPGWGPGALIGQAFTLSLLDHEEFEGVTREGPERQTMEGGRIHFSECRAVSIFQYGSMSIY